MSKIFDHTCALHQWYDVNTDEDRRCGRKLYIFYWIKECLKLRVAVSLSDLLITIQYTVFRKSIST